MKIIKGVFLIVTLLIIGTCINLNVYADDISDSRHEPEVISSIENIFDIDLVYEDYKYLYNGKNEIVAVAYKLNTTGYIVVDKIYNDVIEYSLDNSLLFNNDIQKVYYAGPTYFYFETDAYNCASYNGYIIEKSAIDFCPKRKLNIGDASTLSTNSSGSLLYSTNTYSYNPDGRCGAVASAILLKYYDRYFNSSFIPTSLESTDGVTLINHLTDNYLGTGTSYIKMQTGLTSYLNAQVNGYSAVSRSALAFDVWGKTVEYINNNKPTIILLQDDPNYENHYVVATGYNELNYNGTTRLYTVNNGWGSTGVSINDNYVFAVTYIQ